MTNKMHAGAWNSIGFTILCGNQGKIKNQYNALDGMFAPIKGFGTKVPASIRCAHCEREWLKLVDRKRARDGKPVFDRSKLAA
jgi:hypothetical protein